MFNSMYYAQQVQIFHLSLNCWVKMSGNKLFRFIENEPLKTNKLKELCG